MRKITDFIKLYYKEIIAVIVTITFATVGIVHFWSHILSKITPATQLQTLGQTTQFDVSEIKHLKELTFTMDGNMVSASFATEKEKRGDTDALVWSFLLYENGDVIGTPYGATDSVFGNSHEYELCTDELTRGGKYSLVLLYSPNDTQPYYIHLSDEIEGTKN